jgi:hypothetical protein
MQLSVVRISAFSVGLALTERESRGIAGLAERLGE